MNFQASLKEHLALSEEVTELFEKFTTQFNHAILDADYVEKFNDDLNNILDRYIQITEA